VKIGFSTLGCPGWTLEQAVRAAAEQGYDGIELRLIDDQTITPDLVSAHKERIRRAFAGSGVELASLGSSVRLSMSDPAERARNIADGVAFCGLARELGAPIIRVFGGKRPDGVSLEQGIENVAAGLRAIASAAEDAGVKLVLETHDDFAASTAVAAVMARVPSPAVGALWDTHHPYRMGESCSTVWRNLSGRLIHTHVKDARRKGESDWDLVLLEQGEVPVREAVSTLKTNGWAGYLVVEWEKKWHMEIPDPEVAFPRHIALLRRYLAET
jgi:sugar phosphate isomerase/epimerase